MPNQDASPVGHTTGAVGTAAASRSQQRHLAQHVGVAAAADSATGSPGRDRPPTEVGDEALAVE
ncbi:hypothetical protein ACQP1W_44650 [Spirillospora sp. CA-255316]